MDTFWLVISSTRVCLSTSVTHGALLPQTPNNGDHRPRPRARGPRANPERNGSHRSRLTKEKSPLERINNVSTKACEMEMDVDRRDPLVLRKHRPKSARQG